MRPAVVTTLWPAVSTVALLAAAAPCPAQDPPRESLTAPEAPADAAQHARRLALRVHVREGGAKDAPVVAGATVSVGIGTGSAAAYRGVPLTARQVLAEGATDELGNWRGEIEVPDLAEIHDPEHTILFATAEAPGRLSNTRRMKLVDALAAAPATEGEVDLFVLAQRGVTVRGTVLDTAGVPVTAGRVLFFREKAPDEVDFAFRDESPVNTEGSFEVHLEEGGPWNWQARSPSAGAAGARGLEIDPARPPRDLELRLEGDGVLAGRVADTGGRPVPRYQLWAVPESEPDAYTGYFREPQRLPHEWSGGLFDGHATTDDEGRFRFAGLKVGSYLLRGTQSGSGYIDALLTESPVPTGSEDLLLRTASYRLIVAIRDARGGTVRVQPGDWPRWDALSWPRIYVHESDGQGHVLDPQRGVEGRRTMLADDRIAIEVEPETHYVVGVVSPRSGLVEREVLLQGSQSSLEIDLQLGPEAQSGTLALEVQDPQGAPMSGSTRAVILAPSGKHLFASRRNHTGPHPALALAPGRYTCRVSAPPRYGQHGERFGKPRHIPVDATFDIAPAAETTLPARLGAAGKLRVLVTLDAPPATESRSPLVKITLEPTSGGPPIVPSFEPPSDFPRLPVGSGDVHGVLPGAPETAIEPLPPGDYHARLSRAGYEPQVIELHIVAGETTDLVATLATTE